MPERPSDQQPQTNRRHPRHEDKSWLYAAYCIARPSTAKIPLAECAPVSWDVARAVALVLERLDALEAHGETSEAVQSATTHILHARLYVAALGHLDRLYRHAQEPPLTGEALWRRACEARVGLHKLLDEMDSDGFIVEGMNLPRRRGNSARSVGHELLELVALGHHNDMCLDQYDRDLAARLSDARLQAERLLTSIGDLDAPSVVRELRQEHLQTCEAFVRQWRGLRALLAAHGLDEQEIEQLAPAL
jgi:hypothetical protein